MKFRSCIVALALSMSFSADAASPSNDLMGFGFGMESVPMATAKGLNLSYGTFWVGAWNMRDGWDYLDAQLHEVRRRNLTPVINWWYWGDDISPQCVEDGCVDARHQVFKDRATWYRMTEELSQRVAAIMGDARVIIAIETEFNKNGIETFEPFDGYLAEIIHLVRRRGNVMTVIGFGNWGYEHWPRFDRAAAAADYLGTQLLRSSVRNADSYSTAVDDLLRGARHAQQLFHKQPFTVDLALSSYPEPHFEALQAAVVRELFARMPELMELGMRAIIYRCIKDDFNFDISNYHGQAERHWGFLRPDGSMKAAWPIYVSGVQQTAPSQLTAQVNGNLVTLAWNPPAFRTPALTGYVIDAGTAPGLSDIGAFPAGYATRMTATVAPGTYYVRVRATTAHTVAAASNEVVLNVNAHSGGAPAAPQQLTAHLSGSRVTLTWHAVDSTSAATTYVVEAGSAPGFSDLASFSTGNTQTTLVVDDVPRGRYYLRVRAANPQRTSAPSNEVILDVR